MKKFIIIWCVVFLLVVLVFSSPLAAVNYSSSAHGDSTEGVSRSSLTDDYETGNCGHCHEQHASIDGGEPEPSSPVGPSDFLLLSDTVPDVPAEQNTYYETETACLSCHGGTQNETGVVNNN
ncbi:MAG: hypothetical protein JRG71_09705, partial [Deltaproteobacteria bacterium]|nr:hypothetical protein [Deltaproteobacteria bacterium]